MWELDCKESWAPKNWCFLTVVLEKTLESPLDCKEIQSVHSKGDQSWVHHRFNTREFGWTPGVGDGQGGLACCNSWGRKESDATKWLNWTEMHRFIIIKFKTVIAPEESDGMKEGIPQDFRCICNFLNGGEIDVTQKSAILITFGCTNIVQLSPVPIS